MKGAVMMTMWEMMMVEMMMSGKTMAVGRAGSGPGAGKKRCGLLLERGLFLVLIPVRRFGCCIVVEAALAWLCSCKCQGSLSFILM